MKKVSIILYFRFNMTSSESNFNKFYRGVLDHSDELDPEPIDIETAYNHEREDDPHNLYYVLTLKYELKDESAFKLKKRVLESIKIIENKIAGDSFDIVESKVD